MFCVGLLVGKSACSGRLEHDIQQQGLIFIRPGVMFVDRSGVAWPVLES